MNNPVISANKLSLTYQTNDGPVHALQDINLDIKKENLYHLLVHLVVEKQRFYVLSLN